MSTANPYAPPSAHVTDVPVVGETQPLRLSTYKGRIGRLRYMAWLCGSYLVFGLFGILGALLGEAIGSASLPAIITGVTTILSVILWAFWTIQRSHDMGWNGWTWLWTIIPLVVLIWAFKGGDESGNKYGAPPPANTIGIHILAWMLPFVVVAGILAAVAIPAYQGYAKRAQAVKVGR